MTKANGMVLDAGWGGVTCISPQSITQYQNPFVIVCVSADGRNGIISQIMVQLEEMNIRHCSIDAYIIHKHFDDLEKVYNLLDTESQYIFAGILLKRLTGYFSGIESYYCDNQYFCLPMFRCLEFKEGVFIDCGAYVGDTVESMIKKSLGLFQKIYAFEPTYRTFRALQKKVSFLKEVWALQDNQIICEQKGVGRRKELMSLNDGVVITGNRLTHDCGNYTVEVVSLDEYMAKQQVEHVAFIKADIEGAEWDMLHGAADIIRRDKPMLAICIYHSIFDFFRIPLYLKKLVPEYKFHVRHHSVIGFETILYCHVKKMRM